MITLTNVAKCQITDNRPAEREYCYRNEIVVLLVIASVIYFYRFICLCPHDIERKEKMILLRTEEKHKQS